LRCRTIAFRRTESDGSIEFSNPGIASRANSGGDISSVRPFERSRGSPE
jgi:hypothetical protein